jgi:hypothetical protein
MSNTQPPSGFKKREQDELIDAVEYRELKTQRLLQELGSGTVEKTVFLLAKKLHISERKAREYFLKEWADDNLELFKNGREKLWKWIGTKKKMEQRFDVEKMRRELMPEENDESATQYMQRKNKEKEDELGNRLRARLREKMPARLMSHE